MAPNRGYIKYRETSEGYDRWGWGGTIMAPNRKYIKYKETSRGATMMAPVKGGTFRECSNKQEENPRDEKR